MWGWLTPHQLALNPSWKIQRDWTTANMAGRVWPARVLWPGGLTSKDPLRPPPPSPLPWLYGTLQRKVGTVQSQWGLWLVCQRLCRQPGAEAKPQGPQ